jgi:hypothetical protein
MEKILLCSTHRLPLVPFNDRDAYGCGRGCEITRTQLAAKLESPQDRWRREHGIPVKEEQWLR